ncbi:MULTISPECIES: hypothetical protein [Sorangium]|uniref:Uncharacterized protein n=1 Tax=Sorangium cellulosum TaxID=56 RepID=A0A4P2QQC9_SORCE|nr:MULTISPECIES: hypothetical protein [Sorangium]AUX32380.1 uncharacterized protein SOCE836_045170 [Sorangium cellulosum]WCQ91754.1 hypothetical protein NQZ70_04477 [Sorangium sp. Soce836]
MRGAARPDAHEVADADVADLGLGWDDLDDGYWRLRGGAFALVVVEIEAVAAAENDDLLRLFGHDEAPTLAARRWLAQQVGAEEIAMAMHDLEGFDEVVRKLLSTLPPEQVLSAFPPEQRVAGLPPEQVLSAFPPEQRVAGLPPEQRVAGLPPEQVLLALPDDVLRALSDSYLDTLSAETRAAIRARVGR